MYWLKPLTTRGPASEGDNHDTQVAWLRIAGDSVSRAQLAEARKVFGVHVDTISRSLAGYHAVDYTLSDGTRLRIVSNSGIHHAVMWPAGGGSEVKLPHGFLVVTNWSDPLIYKRRLTTPVTWAIDPVTVPQSKQPIEADNQVFRATGPASYFNHPMVLTDATPRAVWDYTKRGVVPAFASSQPVVPVCVASGSKYDTADLHYCIENVVYAKDGSVIYTMSPAAAILVSDPETPYFAPANTTANGASLVLQGYRAAVISPTFGIYRVRCASEVLTRDASGAYSAVRATAEFDGPVGGNAYPSGTELPELGDDAIPPPLDVKVGDFAATGSGGDFQWIQGFTLSPLPLGLPITQDAFSIIGPLLATEQGAITNSLTLAADDGVEYPDLEVLVNLSGDQVWRGGKKQIKVDQELNGLRWFGLFGSEVERADSQYNWSVSPVTQYALQWANLKLFEGQAQGNCGGKYWVDTVFRGMNIAAWKYTSPFGLFPGQDYIVTQHPLPDLGTREATIAYLSANSIKAAVVAQAAENPEAFVFGPPCEIGEVVANEPTINTASYNYQSRYVIDFDHKGQFWAAIKVQVESTGVIWNGETATFAGDMRLDTLPTTRVRVYFESNWKGTTAQQLLVDVTTTTRPPFEYVVITKPNPYTFGTPQELTFPHMLLRLPPVPKMPLDALQQLRNLMQHQGVNTRLACADVRDDIAEPAATNAQSATGIEFSVYDGRAVQPHRKYVTGQLYARTFRLSDFPGALWMLSALKCDARENDSGSGPSYFYMPSLLTAINTQVFHIEVRDGVIEQWSDEMPPNFSEGGTIGGGSGYPDPNDRDIKLYRV